MTNRLPLALETIVSRFDSVCSVEDYILQKAVSSRQKDWDDITTVIDLQKENIDWKHLLQHCRELSDFLSDSTILTRIQNMR